MEFSVSALSYIGPKTKRMKRLSPEMGVEIFWDWGNEDFWKGVVPELMQDRTGKFSIHGPMMYVAFTDDAPAEKGGGCHGTGDVYASAFTGALTRGKDLFEAAKIAADFTLLCIKNTVTHPEHWYGVRFETCLPELINMLK